LIHERPHVDEEDLNLEGRGAERHLDQPPSSGRFTVLRVCRPGPNNVQRLAVAIDDGALALADDQLVAELELAGAARDAMRDLARGGIGIFYDV
jgi:hypothetical protein